MNILLDYFFPITTITPTPDAATGFLKQALVVCLPKSGQTAGNIYECTTNAQVAVRTDNTEASQLFAAGMSKVYVLIVDDLGDVGAAIEGYESDFFTVLISSDFTVAQAAPTSATGSITVSSYANLVSGTDDSVTIDGVVFTAQATSVTPGDTTFQAATSNNATADSLASQINAHPATSAKVTASVLGAIVTLTASAGYAGNDITLVYTDNDTNVGITLSGLSGGKLSGGDGLELGDFTGVVGISSTDDTALATQAAIANRAAFHTTSSNKAKNMFYAFGKMLSNASNWRNQQYITMPYADDVTTLGDANSLFDDKINFVISDDEFGNRLALFAAGGKAIVGPYIKKNLELDFQSAALSYISGNQPQYTKKQAALLEDELQKVIQSYIDLEWIESGTVEISLVEDNFVATGNINISEPKALWRVFAEMRQTL